jgi:integrase
MKANEITKRDVNVLLEKIVDRGAPVMANNTFKIVRRMFNYAVEKDILVYSPATGVKMPSPKVARQRALSEEEVKIVWATLDSAGMTDQVRRALKLILVTAQRPDEVAGMQASEIDERWWTIPSERTKNGKAQRVYLTDLALELIDGLRYVDPETGEEKTKTSIFPCPHEKKKQPIGRHSLSRAIVNNCPSGCICDCNKCTIAECKKDERPLEEKNLLGIPHFVPHDLRRTAATFMAQAGEHDEVIDSVLNHVKQGVIKVYNTYRYDKEKQAALENWERKLRAILGGAKVGSVINIDSRRVI